MKTCTQCGASKDVSQFHTSRVGRNGLMAHCKQCHQRYVRNNPNRAANNRERYRQQKIFAPEKRMWAAARDRARISGREFAISPSDIIIPSHCPVFGVPLHMSEGQPSDDSPSLDRIDSTRGYTPDNIWVISNRANRLKGDATWVELSQLSEAVRLRSVTKLGNYGVT